MAGQPLEGPDYGTLKLAGDVLQGCLNRFSDDLTLENSQNWKHKPRVSA